MLSIVFVLTTQDFDDNYQLMNLTIEFLEDIVCSPSLLPAEHKAASQLLRYRPSRTIGLQQLEKTNKIHLSI